MQILRIVKFVCFFLILSIAHARAEDRQTVRVVYANNYAPYSYGDHERVAGILVDLANALFRDQLHLNIQHEGLPWRRAQSEIEQGKADIIIATHSSHRSEYAATVPTPAIPIVVTPILHYPGRISESYKDLTDIVQNPKNAVFCQTNGNDWQDEFYRKNKLPYKVVPTTATCLKMLAAGHLDIALMDKVLAEHYIDVYGLDAKLKIMSIKTSLQSAMHIMVSKKSPFYKPEFLQRVDKALTMIANEKPI